MIISVVRIKHGGQLLTPRPSTFDPTRLGACSHESAQCSFGVTTLQLFLDGQQPATPLSDVGRFDDGPPAERRQIKFLDGAACCVLFLVYTCRLCDSGQRCDSMDGRWPDRQTDRQTFRPATALWQSWRCHRG